MHLRAIFLTTALVATQAWAQPERKLTAREIFYAEPSKPTQADKAVGSRPKSRRTPTSPAATRTQIETPVRPDPQPHSDVDTARRRTRDEAPSPTSGYTLVNAPDEALSGRPLGLRVGLLHILPSGKTVEADPDAQFKPGDRLRLAVEASAPGYLYIINRGSSGTWTPLFPSPDIPDASNRVEPGRTHDIPSGYGFTVHDPPGVEKLFIVLSRVPIQDVASLTEEMSRQSEEPAPATRPPKKESMMAMLIPRFDDAAVNRLRELHARDLIIEKVNEHTAGQRKETAVYAVNPNQARTAKVVLDFAIRHE